MKITKYNHSCLLVEENTKVVVIDPGNYSEQIFPTDLSQLDYILITHEHMDHFSLPLINQLVKKFPNVKIITTPSIVEELKQQGIAATTEGDENVVVKPVPHEKVWGGNPPGNSMMTIFGKLAHPGDSHTFTTNAEILALPVTAPWGTTTRAMGIAQTLKPKVIIPIHDWHWKDEARHHMYQWMKAYCQSLGIDFKAIENGEQVEV